MTITAVLFRDNGSCCQKLCLEACSMTQWLYVFVGLLL